MFEFENTLLANRLINRSQHFLLIVGMNVLLEPFDAGLVRVADEFLALQLAHLSPVCIHAIDGVAARRNEGAETLLAIPQCLLSARPLDRSPRALRCFLNQSDLVVHPVTRHGLMNCHECDMPAALDKRYRDVRLHADTAISLAILISQSRIRNDISDSDRTARAQLIEDR